MAGPDELDLDLDKISQIVSEQAGNEMETLAKLLGEDE